MHDASACLAVKGDAAVGGLQGAKQMETHYERREEEVSYGELS
jgi:hypothetical protein